MPAQAQPLRSFFLNGPGGRLECLLNAGSPQATHAALVCHPHPLFGGTLHNKVVYHAMKALNRFGFPVLRFNFRGAGLSEGEHDQGRGERDDVGVALDWLDGEFHRPLFFAGFSFGAAVGLPIACADPRVEAVIGIGTPVAAIEGRHYAFDFLGSCRKPKLLLSGAQDMYGSRPQLEGLARSLPEPKKLVLIDGADHFFAGRLDEMRDSIERWVRDLPGVAVGPQAGGGVPAG